MSADRGYKASVDDHKAIDNAAAAGSQTRTQRETARAVKDFKQAKVSGQLTMKVRVYSPFRDYYDGVAFSITAENATGPFDILPRHHNFISLLCACDLVIRPASGGEQRIIISGGIMHVKADQVIVFLDV
jgi:hypothetical protein